MNPYDPEKAKALLKEAGVATPLNVTLTLPPPQYARKGGEIVAAQLAKVGIVAKIENVEWAQWLSGTFKGNFDLTIINHVEPLDFDAVRQPELLLGLRQQGVPRPGRPSYNGDRRREGAHASCSATSSAMLADRRGQRLHVQARRRSRSASKRLKGLWSSSPIFANDMAAVSLAVSADVSRDGRPARASAPPSCSALYRRKAASPVEVMRAVLAHIERWEPHLHATYALDADARAGAGRAPREARWLKGEPRRPLDGVPATIKENIATARRAGAARHRRHRAGAGRRTTRRRPRACARPAR